MFAALAYVIEMAIVAIRTFRTYLSVVQVAPSIPRTSTPALGVAQTMCPNNGVPIAAILEFLVRKFLCPPAPLFQQLHHIGWSTRVAQRDDSPVVCRARDTT